MGGNDDSCIADVGRQPRLRPGLGNTLSLWAEDCGGIPNPGPGCPGASSDPCGVSHKVAKGGGRREAQRHSRPGGLGTNQKGEESRCLGVLEPESKRPREAFCARGPGTGKGVF